VGGGKTFKLILKESYKMQVFRFSQRC